jgi:hypothetical protein
MKTRSISEIFMVFIATARLLLLPQSDFLCQDSPHLFASKFYRLTTSELDDISVSILFHILSHPFLTKSSGDSLCYYICSRASVNPQYFDLLQFVHFDYLSLESIVDFLSMIPNCVDGRLWTAISPRLTLPTPLVSPLQESNGFDGMISYLTRKHGGNVQDGQIVALASKSLLNDSPDHALRNAANLSFDLRFLASDQPRQWFRWDFLEQCIRPTHYTIKTELLRSWTVTSSLDCVH